MKQLVTRENYRVFFCGETKKVIVERFEGVTTIFFLHQRRTVL